LALAYQERTGRIIDLGCSGNYRIYPPPKEIVAALKLRLRRYLEMVLRPRLAGLMERVGIYRHIPKR
jgi:hypothetical protein